LKKLEVKGWKEKMRDREQWRRSRGGQGSSGAVVPRKKKKNQCYTSWRPEFTRRK
jgi:hypothetical protein